MNLGLVYSFCRNSDLGFWYYVECMNQFGGYCYPTNIKSSIHEHGTTFHVCRSSLVSINNFVVLLYNFTLWLELFILFDAILNRTGFKFHFWECSWLIKKIDFCWSCILQPCWTCSLVCMCVLFRTAQIQVISYETRDSLNFSSVWITHFSCLIAFYSMLNWSGENRLSCLVPNLRRNHPVFHY